MEESGRKQRVGLVEPVGGVAAPGVKTPVATGNMVDVYIAEASKETGLDPKLLAAVLRSESANNPDAVSSKGAIGYAQLMPDTAKEMGVDINDPRQNVIGGARYLKKMYDKYGNYESALAAYNWGPGNYDKFLKGQLQVPQETLDYVPKVMNLYQKKDGGMIPRLRKSTL